MKKRKLGNSELMISPVAFGAWAIGGWMWGGSDRRDAIEAIQTSVEMGMTTIDTAPVYGFGVSEEIVGEAIKGKRDKVEILTKYGMQWKDNRGSYYFSSEDNHGNPIDIYRYASRESVIKECETSLKRLGTDYIDLYQIHWPDLSTPVEETMEAINLLLDQGKIRAAGVCNYDVPLLDSGSKVTMLVSNQVPYSMVRRDIEDDLVPYCIKNNLGILAYSPLQRGLLTGKFSPDHSFVKGDCRPATPYFKKGNIQKINSFLDQFKPLADSKQASLAQLVLRWTIEQSGISCALAGARDKKQVKDNFGAMGFSMSNEDIEFINTRLDQLKLDI